MSSTVYERFDQATARIQAWAILYRGEYVGRVFIKNSERCTAYVQIFGAQMQSGWANGHGYDRHTAAVEVAAKKLKQLQHPDDDPKARAILGEFQRAIAEGAEGEHWDRRLSAPFSAHCVTG